MNGTMTLKYNSKIGYLPNVCNILDTNQVFQDEKGCKINPVTAYGVVYRKAGGFTKASKVSHSPLLNFS